MKICKVEENVFNQKLSKNNNSGYHGIHFSKSNSKWHAVIKKNHKNINLGYYEDIIDAVCARIKGELKYFQELSPFYRKIVKFERAI